MKSDDHSAVICWLGVVHKDDRCHDGSGDSMMTGAPIKEEERATVNEMFI